MQLYAFDVNNQLTFSSRARKQTDYTCPECKGLVRLRGGAHRQNHFYHLEAVRACRQSGKSGQHIALQSYFYERLPKGECLLEHRFEEIGRIADVVWLPEKIVFEIQCSHITAAEVEARNRDYTKAGFQVVWILHDDRYNRRQLSAMESHLLGKPHYFTDMGEDGKGEIYDQFSVVQQAVRLHRLPPLPIDVRNMKIAGEETLPQLELVTSKIRLGSWKGYFAGDLTDLGLNVKEDYFRRARALEDKYFSNGRIGIIQFFKSCLYWGLLRPYQIIFRHLLERYSK